MREGCGMEQKPRALVLVGPTASGKTALSIGVAKALDCEIVCMDSMQIYRGMNIGTAKPMAEEMDGIPHHMLDVADPRESFSVARYQEMAEQVMGEIVARGHTPLLVGGTGFYLRALRNPMAMGGVGSDEAIRGELETIAQKEKSVEMLRVKKAELQAQFDELSSSITNHTVFGQGRIIKAFPEMKHRDYIELIQELKKKLK